jgi:hypothetical protein
MAVRLAIMMTVCLCRRTAAFLLSTTTIKTRRTTSRQLPSFAPVNQLQWRVVSSHLIGISSTTDSGAVEQSSNNIDKEYTQPIFKRQDLVMVEVIYFGPLGASVDVVAHNTHNISDCISQNEPALGRGMILQREIDYYRRSRGGVDVVKYEILPAYVENVREVVVTAEDGSGSESSSSIEERLDISLRPPGGKAKAIDLGEQILEKLLVDKVINVGDKSSPEEINDIFPGASKSAFKKAVSGLYRRGLVIPGDYSITLM